MDTERLLSVVAILRAYATADHVGMEALIKGAPETGYADLLAFVVMLLDYYADESALGYLDKMADCLVSILHDEARAEL